MYSEHRRRSRELKREHPSTLAKAWWHCGRHSTVAERLVDGVVHGVGMATAIALGTLIIVFEVLNSATSLPPLIVYLGSLMVVLTVSLAYNILPISPVKRVLARFDQAAIFLLIAGTYTPFLAVLGGTPGSTLLTVIVWGASIAGIALKLIVPERFGRSALILYLGIGWSGVFVFGSLTATLPPASLWLIVAGGLAYSFGIVFHVWEKLKFQSALWHTFVVAGATLHLVAILVMTLSR